MSTGPAGRHDAGHEAAYALLPWYLNGSLEGEELTRVSRHAHGCLTCTRELRRLEQLGEAMAAPVEAHACTQAFERLARQIEVTETDRGRERWPARCFAALRELFQPVPLAAGASVLVVSSLVVSLIVISGDDAARPGNQPFQTLGQQYAPGSAVTHPLMRVVLSEDGGQAARTAWFERHAAELVDGPSEIGVMTVRVAMGARHFDAVVADMRADAQTLFVEPVKRIGVRPDRSR